MAKKTPSLTKEKRMAKSIPYLTKENLSAKWTITKNQAKRLSSVADIEIEKLAGMTLAKIEEMYKFRIDPKVLFFRKICGKVVKKDPVTGEEYPVPNATVYVEDTDCHFLCYFPEPWPWGWLFPFHCHREVIGKVTTDMCGNFCVWIPRFDIDYIRLWRKKRICIPIVLRRPSIADIIYKYRQIGPWPPIPQPDPGPLHILEGLPESVVKTIGEAAADVLTRKVARLRTAQSLGAATKNPEDLLNARAFETELPPPLPPEFHRALEGHQDVVSAKGASAVEGINSAISMKLGLDPSGKELAGLDLRRYIGPIFRCHDIYVPEWHAIFDVPDITFRVTQDVDGDGSEENIYSESFFDVRWDEDPLAGDVVLTASSTARESHVMCDPDGNVPSLPVPCSNVPEIVLAGFMPLHDNLYFNDSTGYSKRPNRPSNDGSVPVWNDFTRHQAQTPFWGVLNLFGCTKLAGNAAKYYRVRQSTDGVNFTTIKGVSWNLYHTDGTPVTISPDPAGWYNVLPQLPTTDPNSLWPQNLIMEWRTPKLGKRILKVEVANTARNVIGASSPVAIQADNTRPDVDYTRLAWKFGYEGDAAFDLPGRDLLKIPCPTIHRKAVPQEIEVLYEVSVLANHLRDAELWVHGCGGGAFELVSGHATGAVTRNFPSGLSGNTHLNYWHTSGADNSVLFRTRYRLSSTALEGAYTFHLWANSRAINPDGQDGGNLAPHFWNYDHVDIHTRSSLAVAIVNED